MRLDFDRDVMAFSSQPFWLHWQAGTRWRLHVPEFFARSPTAAGSSSMSALTTGFRTRTLRRSR
jgi:hypothetical protein